jgi:hypothetical protein
MTGTVITEISGQNAAKQLTEGDDDAVQRRDPLAGE